MRGPLTRSINTIYHHENLQHPLLAPTLAAGLQDIPKDNVNNTQTIGSIYLEDA